MWAWHHFPLDASHIKYCKAKASENLTIMVNSSQMGPFRLIWDLLINTNSIIIVNSTCYYKIDLVFTLDSSGGSLAQRGGCLAMAMYHNTL